MEFINSRQENGKKNKKGEPEEEEAEEEQDKDEESKDKKEMCEVCFNWTETTHKKGCLQRGQRNSLVVTRVRAILRRNIPQRNQNQSKLASFHPTRRRVLNPTQVKIEQNQRKERRAMVVGMEERWKWIHKNVMYPIQFYNFIILLQLGYSI